MVTFRKARLPALLLQKRMSRSGGHPIVKLRKSDPSPKIVTTPASPVSDATGATRLMKDSSRTAKRQRASLFGRYPATGWTVVMGLLVAVIAILPHMQSIATLAAHTLSLSGVQVAEAKAGSLKASNCNWYTVAPGDTLSQISAQYGVSVESIATVNQIADPNLIFVDQVLCIPPASDA